MKTMKCLAAGFLAVLMLCLFVCPDVSAKKAEATAIVKFDAPVPATIVGTASFVSAETLFTAPENRTNFEDENYAASNYFEAHILPAPDADLWPHDIMIGNEYSKPDAKIYQIKAEKTTEGYTGNERKPKSDDTGTGWVDGGNRPECSDTDK